MYKCEKKETVDSQVGILESINQKKKVTTEYYNFAHDEKDTLRTYIRYVA